MRAVWLEIPEEILEERRRRGLDKRDEVWDGVLHVVPPLASRHGRFTLDLQGALRSIAGRRGLLLWGEGTGIFGAPGYSNYRIPDASLSRPDQVSSRGLEGAELVVEVLSPEDESREKLPFYADVGVREVWLIEPETRATEIFMLAGERYAPVAFVDGAARSPVLGITLAVVDGPKLRLADGDEISDV